MNEVVYISGLDLFLLIRYFLPEFSVPKWQQGDCKFIELWNLFETPLEAILDLDALLELLLESFWVCKLSPDHFCIIDIMNRVYEYFNLREIKLQ